jgi:hypothetical protein
MADTGVEQVNTIYTQKVENHPNEDRGYYIVNSIEYGYHPSCKLEKTQEGKNLWMKFGKNFYITEIQEVYSDGTPRGLPFGGDYTTNQFLKKFTVHRNIQVD